MNKKDELIELADTINDTPVFIYDNTTPTYINSKIIENSSKIIDNLYLNHFSNIEKNICTKNDLDKDKKPENKILLQRENRRIISMIKKIIAKKESLNTTKLSIKNLLINYRKDIYLLKDDKKNTLLHIYVESNDISSLKIILDVYIDILKISKNFYYFLFSKNIEEKNVFDMSVANGQIPIIKLLYEQIEKENVINEKKIYIQYIQQNLFHIAVNNNQIFPIIFFYEKLKIFYKNNYKEESILDSQEINNDKMTPIHYACKNKNIKLMNLLIDLGAYINSQDGKGYTPLHYAVVNNDERMVKHLLIRGANKFIKDENNITSYELSCFLGDNNLKKILYHKNCFQKQFCGEEIGPISKKNNMCFLFIGLIITLIIKFIIFIRFYFILSDINIDFNFLFSLCNDGYINSFINKKDNFSLNDFFSCVDDDCITEECIFYFTLFIDLLLLLDFILFKCSRNIFLPKKKEYEESLTTLFEKNENKNICVKCRIVINDKTQHCLICDRCVENWDHHCFWLNTCINDKNYKKFKFFIIGAILFLSGNLIFYLTCVYLLFNSKDLFMEEFFIINSDLANKITAIILNCIFIYLIIIIFYSLLFVIIPIMKYICKKSKKNKKKKNKKEKEYKSINNIIDNEDEDDIINISPINKGK